MLLLEPSKLNLRLARRPSLNGAFVDLLAAFLFVSLGAERPGGKAKRSLPPLDISNGGKRFCLLHTEPIIMTW